MIILAAILALVLSRHTKATPPAKDSSACQCGAVCDAHHGCGAKACVTRDARR